MNTKTDQELVRAYTLENSEEAFAELVRRHVHLVYSVALRLVVDPHLAEDVTQGTFIALAQNAHKLAVREVLSSWLHLTARNLAAKLVRTEERRRAREKEAVAMETESPEPEQVWSRVALHLDEAISCLSDKDRDALMLRFFERKSAQDIAMVLDISTEAAQKRVSRAVERLRELFAKRGVTIGASGLVTVVSANAVQAAPVGLDAMITTSAALAGTTLATTITATKAIAMTALQKTLITAVIAAAVGTGIYEARQASTLRSQAQTLQQQQQQSPLAEQLTALQTENERLSNEVAQAKDSHALWQAQSNELWKLRGQSTLAQADSRKLAVLKASDARLKASIARMRALDTNSMMDPFQHSLYKITLERDLAGLSRMKKMLNLSVDQEQAISTIITNAAQRLRDPRPGVPSPIVLRPVDVEAETKALLTPEQLAAYPEFAQAEGTLAAENTAKSEASQIARTFSLPADQQEKLRGLLYEMNTKGPDPALVEQVTAQGTKSGKLEDFKMMGYYMKKMMLEEKLKNLAGILSPEQIATYRQAQMDRLDKDQRDMGYNPPKPAKPAN